MKTLILAGGRGTRLGALTKSVNKHLLPLGAWPIISHAFLVAHDINKDVLLITNPENISDFAILGSDFPHNRFNINYAAQHSPDGIADAIRCGESFCNRGSAFVLLGDNIFSPQDAAVMKEVCSRVDAGNRLWRKPKFGAHIWVTESDNPSAYGVLTTDETGKPISVEEKPENPTSNLITVGAYVFDHQLWDIIPKLEKSERGEYEITGILDAYLNLGQLQCHKLQGDWFDVGGSIDGYWKVSSHMRDIECTFS